MARKRTPTPAAEPAANLAGLIQDCKDHPDDDGLRGILADYLEDHGEPDRAEVLRYSLASDSAPALARMAHLALANGDWLGEVPASLHRSCFQRGMLTVFHREDVLSNSVRAWLRRRSPWVETLRLRLTNRAALPEACAAIPEGITRLQIEGVEVRGADRKVLATGALAAQLRCLVLKTGRKKAGVVQALFKKCELHHLRELALEGIQSTEDLQALAAAPFAPSLRALALHLGNDETPLPNFPVENFPNLRRLVLCHMTLPEIVLPPGLTELVLHHVEVSEAALVEFAHSPVLRALERLTLFSTRMNDAILRALAESPHLENLRSLRLGWCGFHAPGLEALAAATGFPRLETLELPTISSGVPLRPLLSSRRFPALRHLTLGGDMGSAGLVANLMEGPVASNLRTLRLSEPLDGVARLAEAPALGNLEVLDLSGRHTLDREVLALANSKTLERLTWLDLTLWESGAASLPALGQVSGLPALAFLRVGCRGSLDRAALLALRNSPRRVGGCFIETSGGSHETDLRDMSNLPIGFGRLKRFPEWYEQD